MLTHSVNPTHKVFYHAAFGDSKLSLKAKGLLGALLACNNMIHISDIVSGSSDGETAVRSAMNELIELGYVKRESVRDEVGRIKTVRWVVLHEFILPPRWPSAPQFDFTGHF